jgi:hypothetical protein
VHTGIQVLLVFRSSPRESGMQVDQHLGSRVIQPPKVPCKADARTGWPNGHDRNALGASPIKLQGPVVIAAGPRDAHKQVTRGVVLAASIVSVFIGRRRQVKCLSAIAVHHGVSSQQALVSYLTLPVVPSSDGTKCIGERRVSPSGVARQNRVQT